MKQIVFFYAQKIPSFEITFSVFLCFFDDINTSLVSFAFSVFFVLFLFIIAHVPITLKGKYSTKNQFHVCIVPESNQCL